MASCMHTRTTPPPPIHHCMHVAYEKLCPCDMPLPVAEYYFKEGLPKSYYIGEYGDIQNITCHSQHDLFPVWCKLRKLNLDLSETNWAVQCIEHNLQYNRHASHNRATFPVIVNDVTAGWWKCMLSFSRQPFVTLPPITYVPIQLKIKGQNLCNGYLKYYDIMILLLQKNRIDTFSPDHWPGSYKI